MRLKIESHVLNDLQAAFDTVCSDLENGPAPHQSSMDELLSVVETILKIAESEGWSAPHTEEEDDDEA